MSYFFRFGLTCEVRLHALPPSSWSVLSLRRRTSSLLPSAMAERLGARGSTTTLLLLLPPEASFFLARLFPGQALPFRFSMHRMHLSVHHHRTSLFHLQTILSISFNRDIFIERENSFSSVLVCFSVVITFCVSVRMRVNVRTVKSRQVAFGRLKSCEKISFEFTFRE